MNFIKSKSIVFILFTLFSSLSFADDFSAYEMDIINQIQEFRFTTRALPSAQAAIDAIADYRKTLLTDDVRAKLSKEAELPTIFLFLSSTITCMKKR